MRIASQIIWGSAVLGVLADRRSSAPLEVMYGRRTAVFQSRSRHYARNLAHSGELRNFLGKRSRLCETLASHHFDRQRIRELLGQPEMPGLRVVGTGRRAVRARDVDEAVGQVIYLYQNLDSNQIVYSLYRILDVRLPLPQWRFIHY